MEGTGVVRHEPRTCNFQELEESPSKTKKPKLVAYESSDDESSISALEDDNCGSILDSFDVRRRQLLEMGCSIAQVTHAIEICGKDTDILDMFDFIQATSYDSFSEGCTSNVATLKVDSLEDQENIELTPFQNLENMGFSSSAISNAMETCESLDIEVLLSFLLKTEKNNLPYGEDLQVDESGQEMRPYVDKIEDQVDMEMTPVQKLEGMGFSSSAVNNAMQTCESLDVDILLNFLLEAEKNKLPLGGASQVEESGQKSPPYVDSFEDEVDMETTAVQQLKKMGFSPFAITNAMERCECRNTHVLLNFLLEAEKDNLPQGEVEESGEKSPHCVNSVEHRKDIVLTPFQILEKMGFSSFAIKNAMETCETLDLEDLVNCLLVAEKDEFSYKEDSQVDGSCQKLWASADYCEDEENIEFMPFKRLEKMGYSSKAIKYAMETCESLDFDDLLSFIFEADIDDLPYGEDLEESGQKSGVYEETVSAGSKVIYETSPSRAVSSPVTWTRDKIRLWYTYLGLKQDFFSDPDSLASAKKISVLKMDKCEEKRGFNCGSKPKRGDAIVPEKMMGFSIPGFVIGRPRPLPEIMEGPPYFYFENVAGAPKSEWDTIRRHLHGVDVEYTDSKFFSANRRPRGYVHNIPIDNRKHIKPEPPMTIFEALPDTEKYWPHWDTRDKLNCINTRRASETLSEMIRSFFEEYGELEMPYVRQQEILRACKRFNLVWVGPGQAAGLEPHEMELLLGFDRDHTRGCSSMTDRYAALGNSFQVNTVAYHLSPLKSLYPKGITVLSLFSGIGGAEVALHKSGIILKAVVAVESNVKASNAITSWWKKTGQTGKLKHLHDVRELTYDVLSGLIDEFGKIDLIIGGSPCNNLSGCNRVSRVGLNGKESSLFFEYPRILTLVKVIMTEKGYI